MNTGKFFSISRARGSLWLRDPGGRRLFYTSVQCVSPRHGSRVPGAPAYDGVRTSGGSLSRWIERTEKRLKDWNLKGLGAWNHPLWHFRSVPFTESLSIWHSLRERKGLKPVFDADWEDAVLKIVAPQVRRLRDASSLIGFFLDNEIRWDLNWLDSYFNGRRSADPNRLAVLRFLKGRHRRIGRLNRAWGTRIASFGALAKMRKLPAPVDAARSDRLAFLSVVARRFFRTTCRTVRRLAPGRLILGVRYAGFPLPQVVAAQKGNTDVVSMNLYIQEGEFPAKQAWQAHRASGGQPVWVTEFAWHAPFDNRSGDRNRIGFGSRVRHQRARAKGYEKFVSGAARLPFVIGMDWFQWCDESPEGRGDGEDVNFGLVDIKDRPYAELVASIRRTGARVDGLHARARVYRPPLSREEGPPYCVLPRHQGGRSAGAEITDLKFRPSLDPLPASVPARAWGNWEPGGVKITVDVADRERTVELGKVRRQIEWFWMTDAAEVLIRSGGARENPPEVFDASSVKVFAVPDGLGRGRPFFGAVRSHRRAFGASSGARVRQFKRPGGYRLNYWIPARILQRGALKAWQVLRFNILIEDCEKVREVCWSAHQGDWTTEKPRTWGRLILAP